MEGKSATDPIIKSAGPGAGEGWRSRFGFDHVKVLIICRGPIRLEAIQVFERMGTQPCGILLSEKDSVVYSRALSPELRRIGRNERVHRIPDYAGRGAAETRDRIERIIAIAKAHDYTHVFAGYGFMAEDFGLIRALEDAGVIFIGPASPVVEKAGAKDAAKALARRIGVSVTPGLDNIEARALLAQADGGDPLEFLRGRIRENRLEARLQNNSAPETDDAGSLAEAVLSAARMQKLELVTLAQLQAEAESQVKALLAAHPGKRLRFKHVGGGGGKGQRIVSRLEEVPAAVTEVLNEANATGAGANRNFLIELNIEATRHNEVQLLGNGDWCVALGGRDCSLQMHEQKLLEVSISEELLKNAVAAHEAAGKTDTAEVLRDDLRVLQEMEQQAARFGEAVGLNSASTFESIVDGSDHFFMEVNTRIQVEHRVTEMIYALRFENPARPKEAIVVESLVEAMLWMAVYGPELPRPERISRHGSGAEARINATNHALKPHAGGVVLDWSPPIAEEMRDDQGIGIRNPDTGEFMTYHLAGAYDSNVALLVSHGRDREDNFRNLAEIIRLTNLRGHDLRTNMDFHYGLLHWMLGAHPLIKPTTRFVTAYLAGVGALEKAGRDLELDMAWEGLAKRQAELGLQARHALDAKRTLILRPLRRLYGNPHLMAGWLAPRVNRRFVLREGRVVWMQNPLEVLNQLYHYLRLEAHPGVSPEARIWPHDQDLLDAGLAFYRELQQRLDIVGSGWPDLVALLEQEAPPKGFGKPLWRDIRAAHRGHQAGLALLELPLLTGEDSGFYNIRVNDRLEVEFPAEFEEPATADALRLMLDEAPEAASNEVVAFTGGTCFARPSPEEPPFVAEGQHVEQEQVLALLEVMKMFNPVRAPFAGTVKRVLLHGDGGQLVQKGQLLFELEPDVPIVKESQAERRTRQNIVTGAYLARL